MTAREILERIWEGRRQLRELHINPELKDVELIMSVDLHMRLMGGLSSLGDMRGVVEIDHSLPAAIRIWGMVVRRDPNFRHNEMTFRSEVQI